MAAHAAFDLLTFVPSRNNHSLPKTNPVAMNNNPNDISYPIHHIIHIYR
ncbi:hypothetical protein MCC10015_2277 [Bifidobacterium longum subsp. longum]|uniref:Uncharacterized protein n=1 Tax=Bifidobacterium longum subsp. longum TaxID=1679 RepID=A0A4R0T3N2_BIFLL|nr:hypothetical protein MCC10015_2277 [Bifidobacterium longum subsp. longum]TCD99800.1 hypothetical protein MCC10018_1770 [Bifidobacterium longum subsp. longum]